MLHVISLTSNENESFCRSCGGQCCQRMPGLTLPEQWGAPDWDVMAHQIRAALETGRWAIDWWEGDPRPDNREDEQLGRVCYVRPAITGKEGRLRDPAWGGPCTFLGSSGCALLFEQRPYECQILKPSASFPNCCYTGLSKRQIATAWVPYQDIVEYVCISTMQT